MNNPAIRNAGILLARVGIGIIFVAHGWQKAFTNGFGATKAAFDQMGVPVPGFSAFFATWVELLGGIALIIGALVPIVGALLVLDMVGAFFTVHIGSGIWVSTGGYELVLALGASALLLAVVGSGAFGVDGAFGAKLPWVAKDSTRA